MLINIGNFGGHNDIEKELSENSNFGGHADIEKNGYFGESLVRFGSDG